MTEAENQEADRFGQASISPKSPAIAGSVGTWKLTYRVGSHGIDDGGAFRVALHTTTDWSAPQFDQPEAPNYVAATVWTAHSARIEMLFDPDMGVRPWKRILQVRIRDAALWPGDKIIVTFGESQLGSPGIRSQTFSGPMTFRCLVDAFGTGVYELVEPSPVLQMCGGRESALHVLGPSDVAQDSPFSILVRVNDTWGNVAQDYLGSVQLSLPL